MTRTLESGERVHVTTRRHVGGYSGRERGTVMAGPSTSAAGWSYYFVQMDADDAGHWTVFAADEIEPESARPDTAPVMEEGTRLIEAPLTTSPSAEDDLSFLELANAAAG